MQNIEASPFLSIGDATLLMSNQFLKRFFFEKIDFHQKIPIEKLYFWMSKNFGHDFRKFSRKFSKSQNFQLEFQLTFLRFRKMLMKFFENRDRNF